VSIERIRIDRGALDFADLTLNPQFEALIRELKGSVAGLANTEDARAHIELEGRVDEFGSAKIEGQIRPLNPRRFTDVEMTFRNLNMPNVTPYSAKFAGYEIAEGKLSLDLRYKIENSQLLGENQIVIDHLTLGEKVESPGAKDLPLELAVALLKDRNGRIDIGLPVKGDLENPEFSYGHLIWKALGNLIVKIVTAPFALIGNLLGVESTNLDAIGFEPGDDRLLPPEQEKLKNLAEALRERPKLQLEIQGGYNPRADGMALKTRNLRHAIATRSGQEIAPGEDPGPVVFTSLPTQNALEALFMERYSNDALGQLKSSFQKPVAAEKKEGTPPPKRTDDSPKPMDPVAYYEAVFKRLLQKEALTDEMLQQLAADRTAAITDELTTQGGIDAGRLAIVDADKKELSEGLVAAKLSLGVHQ
jgi:hypothetical protein